MMKVLFRLTLRMVTGFVGNPPTKFESSFNMLVVEVKRAKVEYIE